MKRVLLCAAALFVATAPAHAQSRPRWRLDYEQEKPRIHTHRDDLDRHRNYWYFTYTLTNNTDEIVPILTDLMLYTDTGKDLQNDVAKVDPDPAKATLEDPRNTESYRFGTFCSNVVVSEAVEYKIIEQHAGLGNRSPGIVRESIEELKRGFLEDPQAPDVKGRWKAGDRLYLNPREMRQQRFIRPGQRIQGVAIFQNVDPRARRIEVHASGLWDVVRIDGYEPEDVRLHYENRVLKLMYDFKGDEYNREIDVLVYVGRRWVVKPIGPIASKETIQTLVDTLLARLKLEERWSSGDVKAEDADSERKLEQLTPQDFAICARIVRIASGKDFGFDSEKSLIENKAPVWRIHEWWVTSKTRLAFNQATGRFEEMEETLPGRQKD